MYVCVYITIIVKEEFINLRNSKKKIGVVGEGRDKDRNNNNNNNWNNN